MAADAALVARALHARADDLERRAAERERRGEHPDTLRFLAAEINHRIGLADD
jgi:hypothetical protein